MCAVPNEGTMPWLAVQGSSPAIWSWSLPGSPRSHFIYFRAASLRCEGLPWAAGVAGLRPQLGCDGSRNSHVPGRNQGGKANVMTIQLCGLGINFTLWGIYNSEPLYYIQRKGGVFLGKLSSSCYRWSSS